MHRSYTLKVWGFFCSCVNLIEFWLSICMEQSHKVLFATSRSPAECFHCPCLPGTIKIAHLSTTATPKHKQQESLFWCLNKTDGKGGSSCAHTEQLTL